MSFLSELSSKLSLPPANKAQQFASLSLNSTFYLLSGISSHLQKLVRYFNGTVLVTFGAGWEIVYPSRLVSYLKDLKLSVLAIKYILLS